MSNLSAHIGILLVVFLVGTLTGCADSSFQIKDLAKSDVDMVADLHLTQADHLLNTLTQKLYRRNPAELRKRPGLSIEDRLHQLFDDVRPATGNELQGKENTEAILLGLDPSFSGDRVFALMSGLVGMVHAAYGNRSEFYMLSQLDAQSLYNSARNLEILVWRLNHRMDDKGRPLLLTNSLPEETPNLSYERLFGKLIALQDMMARIAADQSKRTLNTVVHNVATSAFLPVGI